MADLTAIAHKGFTTIRTYSTDCSGLQSIGPAARANKLKVILGVFIKGDGCGGAQSQVSDIVAFGKAGNWDLVSMIVVGNEAIFQSFTTGPALAAFISSAKASFQAAGSGSIPVTTSETVAVFVANAQYLCPVIDVVASNMHAYFDATVTATNAGSWVLTQLGLIEAACPGKPSYNLESGWPSAGGTNGNAIASTQAQSDAIGDIIAKAGQKTVVFSPFNDLWKAPGVEQNFGCQQLF
jgi:exo-beta-1,3-glucanase (GH17 family)